MAENKFHFNMLKNKKIKYTLELYKKKYDGLGTAERYNINNFLSSKMQT